MSELLSVRFNQSCPSHSESQRLAIRRFSQNERLGDSTIWRFGDSADMVVAATTKMTLASTAPCHVAGSAC
jgi:hypothetical protein